MIHTPKSLLFASAALALALGVQANPAWAADAAPANDSSNVVQTLVVTAQRKEEAIQDVPVAVSAFSADKPVQGKHCRRAGPVARHSERQLR